MPNETESFEEQWRKDELRHRIAKMLRRHNFRNANPEPLVQFAIERNLDQYPASKIYEMYSVHQVMLYNKLSSSTKAP